MQSDPTSSPHRNGVHLGQLVASTLLHFPSLEMRRKIEDCFELQRMTSLLNRAIEAFYSLIIVHPREGQALGGKNRDLLRLRRSRFLLSHPEPAGSLGYGRRGADRGGQGRRRTGRDRGAIPVVT
jgi:hypothetical protein